MSSTWFDHVYLAPARRRPSFDQFVEASLQSPALRRQLDLGSPEPPAYGEYSSMTNVHSDDLDTTADSQLTGQSFDRAKDIIRDTVRDMQPVGRSMNEIEESGDDFSDPEVDLPEEESSDTHDPTPEPEPATRMPPRTRQRIAESPADESDGKPETKKRDMRKRTDTQMNPFTKEKVKHSAKMKLGKDANASDIEHEEWKSTQQKSKTRKSKSPAKTARKTSNNSRASGRSSASRKFSTDSTVAADERSLSNTPESLNLYTPPVKLEVTSEQVIEKTKFFICLKEDPSGPGVTVPLEHVQRIDMLIDFVKNSWVKWKGVDLDSIECILPWKKENQVILLREGLDYCFEGIMEEIRDAPAWKKGHNKLEVKLLVNLL